MTLSQGKANNKRRIAVGRNQLIFTSIMSLEVIFGLAAVVSLANIRGVQVKK